MTEENCGSFSKYIITNFYPYNLPERISFLIEIELSGYWVFFVVIVVIYSGIDIKISAIK